MPKVRPLTRQERETQAIENETKRICTEVLTAVREKRGLEEKTYAQVAEEIGISVDRLNRWRNGELPGAGFGRPARRWVTGWSWSPSEKPSEKGEQ